MPSGKVKGRIRVKVDKGKLVAAVDGHVDGLLRRGAQRAQRRARDIIWTEGRVRTGRMMDQIAVEPAPSGKGYRIVANAPHSIYQEKGVRPFSMPKGKVMAFMPKGTSTVVFATKSKGFPGIHFMKRTYEQMNLRDFTER